MPTALDLSRLPPLRLNLRPGRFAREIFRCLERDFLPLEPDDRVPPELLARVNRLLIRGGRLLAHAPGWQRARPFPAGIEGYFRARTAVIALMKLLYRADPLLGLPPEERLEHHRRGSLAPDPRAA